MGRAEWGRRRVNAQFSASDIKKLLRKSDLDALVNFANAREDALADLKRECERLGCEQAIRRGYSHWPRHRSGGLRYSPIWSGQKFVPYNGSLSYGWLE